jgi:hypothetical protein
MLLTVKSAVAEDEQAVVALWRACDLSNPRSPVRRTTLFETPLSQHARAPRRQS